MVGNGLPILIKLIDAKDDLSVQVHFRADSISFRVLLCMNGCGVIRWEENILNIYEGDCVFFPADSVEVSVHGQMQMLNVRG